MPSVSGSYGGSPVFSSPSIQSPGSGGPLQNPTVSLGSLIPTASRTNSGSPYGYPSALPTALFSGIVESSMVNDLDIIISYEEDKILGTAGGIKKAFSNILQNDDYFLCINPDIIYDTNVNIYEIVKDFKGKCLLYLFENEYNTSYTNLNFRNKKVYFENGNYMFIGLSIMQFSIFKDIEINEYYDLANIFKKLSINGELEGEIFPGRIIDLGEEDKYLKYTENL
jgi:NDP-sugar pyrophosphorylase family protein